MRVSSSLLHGWLWFVAWLLVGGGFMLGVLTPFTTGISVVPAAVLAAIALARLHRPRGELLGLLSGLGIALLYAAISTATARVMCARWRGTVVTHAPKSGALGLG